MEKKIAEMKLNLDQHTKKQAEIKKYSTMLSDHHTIQSNLSTMKNFALRNFDRFKSMEGIFSWDLKEIDDSYLRFEFLQSDIPALHVSVTIQDGSSSASDVSTSCRIVTEVSLIEENDEYESNALVSSEFSKNTLDFIEKRISNKCHNLCHGKFSSSTETFQNISQIEWYLSRLALVGKEITLLEKRYNGELKVFNERKSCFLLDLNIPTKKQCLVVARFEICEAYPFIVPAVDLYPKGNSIDVRALERHLMKSSRPGFGYLSRTCNTISCFST